MLKNNTAFTLIEILLGILIVAMVIIGGFQALSAVTLGKIKLVEKADIVKDTFYFSEKLFEEIKKGGTVDFEEYFNRKVVGNSSYLSGHYDINTGFGNFGNGGNVGTTTYGKGFYYCRSIDGFDMGTKGCYNATTYNDLGISNGPQRYMQYMLQFIDYNANDNSDSDGVSCLGPDGITRVGTLGDEDCDGNMRGDDDDETIGEGPTIFTGGTDIKEIYLISGNKKKRTLFRWNWFEDPNRPNTVAQCNGTTTTFGSGCLGTIEFLKLEGFDWGENHLKSGTGYLDGIMDTWLIDKEFTGGTEVIAGGNSNNYRQPLFPNSISVTDFKVFMYPDINRKYAWKNPSSSEVNPYVRIQISLSPSWKKRGGMKGKIPQLDISTTINLTDYFNK